MAKVHLKKVKDPDRGKMILALTFDPNLLTTKYTFNTPYESPFKVLPNPLQYLNYSYKDLWPNFYLKVYIKNLQKVKTLRPHYIQCQTIHIEHTKTKNVTLWFYSSMYTICV